MSNNTAITQTTNIVPVQGIFEPAPTFALVTLIGPAGTPFYANVDPAQSGLNITNSTINSTTIGATTPSTATFTQVTLPNAPVNPTDATNKVYVDNFVAGISWKEPVLCATTANITLSGTQTIDSVAVVAGDRVLVKDQSTAANNGIYVVSAGAWTRAVGADDYAEYEGAVVFVISGSGNAGTTWYCSAQPGGTLGVTALNWFSLSISLTYTAGTGLTLTGTQFSITNTGVSAATYGSASTVPVLAVNAQGQLTSVTNTSIAINGNQITSGTVGSSYINGTYSGITGVGTLTDLTVTNAIVGSITGNAATATTAGSATTATTATNIAGGASGSIPYQTGSGATALLAKGTDGQVLALASGLPAWIDNQTGTVTSVSGTGTVSGISLSGTVTSSGSLTLGGTLDLSSPPAIGGTTANTVRGTTVTATSSFVSSYFDASGSGGGSLRTSGGSACLQWGGGGGVNVTIDGAINMNGANASIQMNPTGTGAVSIAPGGALTVNPTTASTMNNVAIGGTTPLAGTFTDLRVNNTISLAGSTGTSGYVLTSNGASAPTWQANASGLEITDDTTTNATRYLTFTSATSGSITGANVSSTKLAFNPNTGNLGIGTSSPNTRLDVSGITNVFTNSAATAATATTYALAVGNSAVRDMTLGSDATYALIQSWSGKPLYLNSQGNNVLFGTGNVGIGTTSPGVKLDVAGAIRSFVSGGTPIVYLSNGTTQHSIQNTSGAFTFFVDGTERMRLDSAGNALFTNAVRATVNTNNTLTFNMNNASNFKSTPTAGGALTFTNITSGQTGNIILVNGSNYAITAAATTKVSATCLATISATGTYWLSYYTDGTNVYVANTGALA
jgi:hypothetical protein